jgi:hypothetical protein
MGRRRREDDGFRSVARRISSSAPAKVTNSGGGNAREVERATTSSLGSSGHAVWSSATTSPRQHGDAVFDAHGSAPLGTHGSVVSRSGAGTVLRVQRFFTGDVLCHGVSWAHAWFARSSR